MFHTKLASKSFINRAEYQDKILGCWTGKNIGGTLGAPFEGKKETHDLTFYAQELNGNPAPNDDLDLQLAWLLAVEEHGLYNVNELVLGVTDLGLLHTFHFAQGLKVIVLFLCSGLQVDHLNSRNTLWPRLLNVQNEPDIQAQQIFRRIFRRFGSNTY